MPTRSTNTGPTAAFSPNTATPTDATPLQFTLTFSENVYGVDVSDFSLVTTGTVTGNVHAVSTNGAVCTITVSGISGDGTLAVKLNDDASVIDRAFNSLTSGTTSDAYTLNTSSIDNTAPTVAADTVSTGPTSDDSLVFVLNFDEIVTGVDITDLALVTTGTATGTITAVHSNDGLSYGILVTNVSGDGTLAPKTQQRRHDCRRMGEYVVCWHHHRCLRDRQHGPHSNIQPWHHNSDRRHSPPVHAHLQRERLRRRRLRLLAGNDRHRNGQRARSQHKRCVSAQ